MSRITAVVGVLLSGLLLAGCSNGGLDKITSGGGASDGTPHFTSAKQLATRIGCSSYEERPGDIGFPQYVREHGRCTLNGHFVFIDIFREPGQPAQLRAELAADEAVAGVTADLDHWVSGTTWEVSVPEAEPGEIAKLNRLIGDPDADMKE